MSEPYCKQLEACLAPVEAPDELWARVEAGLEPKPARRISPSFLAAGLLIVLGIGAFGYLENRPARRDAYGPATTGEHIDRNSQHVCFACHV
jgi:hypothetical protein